MTLQSHAQPSWNVFLKSQALPCSVLNGSQKETSFKHLYVFHSTSVLYRLHCIRIVLCCFHSRFNLEIDKSNISEISENDNEGEEGSDEKPQRVGN